MSKEMIQLSCHILLFVKNMVLLISESIDDVLN